LEALQGHLDCLGEEEVRVSHCNALGLMEAEVHQLCDLLSDAMLLQKLEAGKVQVNLEAADPYSLLIAASRHLLEPKDGSRSRLICKFSTDLPLIQADQDLTEAVISDLLTRGMKYSDLSEPVTLSVERAEGQLAIHVSAQRFAPIGNREFATEIALCCKRIEVQGGEVTCKVDAEGFSVVTVTLPVLAECGDSFVPVQLASPLMA
jgi:signal transduction histidine kinase